MLEIYRDSSGAIFCLWEVATLHAALFLCHPDGFKAIRLIGFLFYIMWAHAAKPLLSRRASHRLLSPGNSPIAHCAWAEDMIVIQLTMGSVLLGRRRKLMFLPFSAHPLIPPSTVFPIQAFVDVLMPCFQIGLNHGNVTMSFSEKSNGLSKKTVKLVSG